MNGAQLIHGGRLHDACRRFGGSPADWLDLSTGINPCPWQPPEALRPDWHRLPDPHDLAALEAGAAAFFGADAALCCAVPGSEAGLRALAPILGLPGRHRALTYRTHGEAFAPGDHGADDAPTTLVLANPNNPDGLLLSRGALLDLLARQERDGGWLVVDEAFADPQPEHSVAGDVGEGRRLIVTRSFGKFFGLAGVRLGFVIAPPAVLDALRHLHGEWPASAAALAFGTAAYADHEWIAATRRDLAQRMSALDAILAAHGLMPRGASPLFRLVESEPADDLFIALARRRILTRPFAGHPRLLRLGVPGTIGDRERLDAALTELSADD